MSAAVRGISDGSASAFSTPQSHEGRPSVTLLTARECVCLAVELGADAAETLGRALIEAGASIREREIIHRAERENP